MTTRTHHAQHARAPRPKRFGWWPAALLVLVVFGLCLTAWTVFFRLGSTIDTHRLDPSEVPPLIEKRASQLQEQQPPR